MVTNLPANAGAAGDSSLIPGLGKSPGEGNGNPFQCSCLGNPMDRGTSWATVSPWGHKRVGPDLVTKQQALRSTFCVQGTLLGFRDTEVNTLAEFLLLWSIQSGGGKQTMNR